MFSLLEIIPGIPLSQPMLTYAGIGVGAVLLLFVVVVLRRKPKHDPESGLEEILASFPAAPSGNRSYILKVMGQPVRLRLVVIAPTGKKDLGKPEVVLEQVLRGLGETVLDDKPRIRIWPAQLSVAGFAPTFFRHTKKPDADGRPSRWILLAGPARAGGVPVLLGLAVQTDALSNRGTLTLTETQWGEVLTVEEA